MREWPLNEQWKLSNSESTHIESSSTRIIGIVHIEVPVQHIATEPYGYLH